MQLREYVKVVCAILDIPVYANIKESLHVLFTLFSEFKTNVHFQQQFTDAPNNGEGQSLQMPQ